LGALVSSYIPRSREDDLGASLRFQGLDSAEVKEAWDALTTEAHQTPCYQAALGAGERLDGDLRAAAREHRQRITERLETLDLGVTTMREAHDRWREIVRTGYEDAPDAMREAALAIRQYNELVNLILWAALGIAEAHDGLARFAGDVGAVRESGRAPHTEVSLTLTAASVATMGTAEPFLITVDLPADGLYISRRSMVQSAVTTNPYVDVTGQRLGALEATPG
jgi:hypothetical protein